MNVLLLTEDTMIISYCGEIPHQDQKEYKGFLVLSTQPGYRAPRDTIEQAARLAGLVYLDLCELEPETSCVDAPNPFTPLEQRDPEYY